VNYFHLAHETQALSLPRLHDLCSYGLQIRLSDTDPNSFNIHALTLYTCRAQRVVTLQDGQTHLDIKGSRNSSAQNDCIIIY